MIRNLDHKRKTKHNWTRDIILVLLGCGLVVGIFTSESRFNFDPGTMLLGASSDELVYFAGSPNPAELGLTKDDLKPVYDFARRSAKHFKQVEIQLERQDSYGTIKDSTMLRFLIILRFNDKSEMKSVYTRATVGTLPKKIAWRMREDMKKYFALKKKTRGKKINTVTNTM